MVLLMRSVPTALLLDLGMQRSISSVVMRSLRILLVLDLILDTMASCNCGLGGMLVGNTLMICSAKVSDFLRGSLDVAPSTVMLVPSGKRLTPLPVVRFTKGHSRG